MTTLSIEGMMDLSKMVMLYSALSAIIFTVLCVSVHRHLMQHPFGKVKDKILIPVRFIFLCLSRLSFLCFLGSIFVFIFFLVSSWL